VVCSDSRFDALWRAMPPISSNAVPIGGARKALRNEPDRGNDLPGVANALCGDVDRGQIKDCLNEHESELFDGCRAARKPQS
jgi:hypothetical protein